MDSIIISEKNRVLLEIKSIEKTIKFDNNKLIRLKNTKDNRDGQFYLAQKDKIDNINLERNRKLQQLKKVLEQLNNGIVNKEILEKRDTQHIKHKQQENKINKEKIIKKQKETKKKEKQKKEYKKNREYFRQQRYKQKTINRYNQYFYKNQEKIPKYLLDNLKNMPNNKGYIFNDVWCFGELPAEQGKPTYLYKKQKNNLLIHEFTPTKHKIFHKNNKKKKLISSTERENKLIKNLYAYI
jgi:hypothetical protein